MNPIVNLTIVLEKELELERQGLPRTRRWIGDVSRVADSRWYQAKTTQVSGTGHSLEEVSRMKVAQPERESHSSILTRLLNLRSARRQPA
jgi:hypothetical protein